MRVLVCGGRNFNNKELVFKTLDEIHKITLISSIIHGCCKGADDLASDWAWANEVDEERFPAEWDKHGKAAGPIRNQQMLNTKPDLVIAFPGGKGTQHMIKISKDANIEVKEIQEER